VDGLGSVRWLTGDQDEWGNDLWVPALGVWSQDGRFFMVMPPEGTTIVELVKEIVAEKIDSLLSQYRQMKPPYAGDFETLWGRCLARGNEQTISRGGRSR